MYGQSMPLQPHHIWNQGRLLQQPPEYPDELSRHFQSVLETGSTRRQ